MSTITKAPNPVIRVSGRLSFPSLWEPRQDDEPGDDGKAKKPKYEATILMDKRADAVAIAAIRKAIEVVSKDPMFKGRRPNKVGLREGSEKEHLEGYTSQVMFIAARNHKRVAVVDRQRHPLLATDKGAPYPGCFVNATIELYPYVHKKSGPGITASLRAIQFVKDGPAFGSEPVDAENEFDDLGEDSVDGDTPTDAQDGDGSDMV